MAVDEKTTLMKAPEGVAVGSQLSGTYELDERIAAGGMGEVFRGHNIQTGDPVAIKIVLPEFARDAMILSLFRKEASILNHLSHEAIVRYHVFAIDQAMGRPYLAMEFVDGLSLVDMYERGPMSPQDARGLLFRLASGLAAAHEAGVIHRDLSPDNIVLPGGKVSRAKIIDFGIARSASVGGGTLLGGVFAGKYNFVSPEQLGMYGAEITEQSDIYSLGLIMAAVLRGEPLDMSGSQVDVIEKRRSVPDLSAVDPGLRPVLEAMLQPDPRDRPLGMQEIADRVAPERDTRRRYEPTVMAPAVAPVEAAAPETKPNAVADLTLAGKIPVVAETLPEPTSESPFGPYRGPAELKIPELVAAAPVDLPGAGRRSGGRGGAVAAGLAGLLAASVAAVVWYGGFADRFLKPTPTPEPPIVTPETPPGGGDKTEPGTTPGNEFGTTPGTTPSGTGKVEPGGTTPGTSPPETGDKTEPGTTPSTTPGTAPGTEKVEPGTGASTPGTTEQPEIGGGATPDTVEPEAGPAGVDIVAEQIAWLKDFSGGDCFFATATSMNGKATEIEGFGDSVDAFKNLLAEFTKRFQTEPEIGVRLIRPKQCAVPRFLSGLAHTSGNPPDLTLVKYELLDRDPMSGEVQMLPSRQTYLILVDHDGVAHNLDRILKRDGDLAKFSIALGLGTGKDEDKGAVPQILLALATSQQLEAMQVTAPTPAADLLPRILDEINSKKMDGAATARYFRIRG